MLRLVTAASALALFGVPLHTLPTEVVALPGLLALGLAAISIVTLARWPLTGAACVFVIEYALALWLARASISVVGAAGFGFALVVLLQSLEIARSARLATVDARVVRSLLGGWVAFGAATLTIALLVMALARGLAGAIPFAVAPVLAAAGALGVVLALAALLTRNVRH